MDEWEKNPGTVLLEICFKTQKDGGKFEKKYFKKNQFGFKKQFLNEIKIIFKNKFIAQSKEKN